MLYNIPFLIRWLVASKMKWGKLHDSNWLILFVTLTDCKRQNVITLNDVTSQA